MGDGPARLLDSRPVRRHACAMADRGGRVVRGPVVWTALGMGLGLAMTSACFANHSAADPILDALDGMEDAAIAEEWREANRLEAAGDLPAAETRLVGLTQRLPASADPQWRIARNLYRQSKALGDRDKERQLATLERAIEASERGLERDPDCAQCMLWQYAALGRKPQLQGLLSGAGNAKTLAALLQRGIEVSQEGSAPRPRATLAHFYYARASFLRMVPDWFWLKWVFGVRGDKQQALADARRAVELDGERGDFELELAANLLCLGHRDRDEAQLAEADEILQRVRAQLTSQPDDNRDRELAAMLLGNPQAACGYSRDGFVDVDEAARSKTP